jgi:hypothetical protein
MIRYRCLTIFALYAMAPSVLFAAPFASNVVLTGTTVNFILNEPADSLTYSINGGPAVALSGATKGGKTFALGAPSDTFSISAAKYDSVGYTLPTGGTIAANTNGLSVVTNESGFRLISDDTSNFVKFNSPRGVSVSNNPNASNFGTAYISNSTAAATGGRTLTGRGLYAVHADQTDAYGYGDAAQQSALFGTTSTNSPFRTFVAPNGEVYVAGFGDGLSGVWRTPANLSSVTQLLQGTTGPAAIPAGQNHGSVAGIFVEGSSATNDLTLYTVDEDLTSAYFGGPAGDDRNSLWRYSLGGGALPSNVVPTKVNTTNVLIPLATADAQRGADGKFYLAQSRTAGTETGLVVLDSSGLALYDSLTASRTLLGNPTAPDIIRQVFGMAISEDQKWLAVVVNDSDVAVIPLVGGIPDLANRLIVNTGTDVNSGRDIAFDAAGNIHYVSSGQALYRVLSPGGLTTATTSWNGTAYSFTSTQQIPEPASLALVLLGMAFAGTCRRR